MSKFHNWYDDAIISEIAALVEYRNEKGNVNGFFDEHTKAVEEELMSLSD